MTAKPAKTPKAAKPAGPLPAAPGNPDADAEKTYFRVRAVPDAAFDTLGTPADPPPPGAEAQQTAETGLLGRWLGGARPTRPPRRRTPQPPPVEATPAARPGAEVLDAPVIEPEQEAAGPDEAVDSYRSASDLTAPEETPQSDVVA